MITQEQLKSILDYNPETGIFVRKVSSGRAKNKGKVAGGYRKDGYGRISIGNKRYLMHRLAFVWMTGGCPEFVDHIDGNPSNN